MKALATLFYARFEAARYTDRFPWEGAPTPANDYAAANVGQVKNLFSFDFAKTGAGLDLDRNGLPDQQELQYFGHTGMDPAADPDRDGLSNLQECQLGTDPTDFYNAHPPRLAVASGDMQTAPPGSLLPAALAVSVVDAAGSPLANAPVTFSIGAGGGQLKASSSAALVTTFAARTDDNGHAQTFYRLPDAAVANQACQILCTAGTSPHQMQVVFTATCGGPGAPPVVSPFAPTNFLSQGNPDGSLDMSWENHTDEQTSVEIEFQRDDGAWRLVVTLPPGTTSYHYAPGN